MNNATIKVRWVRRYRERYVELWNSAHLGTPTGTHAGTIDGSALRFYCPAIAFRYTLKAVKAELKLDSRRAAAFLAWCGIKDPRP